MAIQAGAFGECLRAYRAAAGLSQQELAGRSGVSVRAIGDMERGRTRWPYRDSVHRLADALGLAARERESVLALVRRPVATATPRLAPCMVPYRGLSTDAEGQVGGLEALAGVLDQAHAEIRERVLRAAALLDIVHPGAMQPRSTGIKEIAGVVYRRVPGTPVSGSGSAEDTENLQFVHVFDQAVEVAARRASFSVLTSSVDANDKNPIRLLRELARKCDGLITVGLGFIEPGELDLLGSQVPLVILGGPAVPQGASVRGDNAAGMRDLARHLIHDHGYQTLAYLAGNADCPDNADRRNAVAAVADASGIELLQGPDWQGSYYLHGGMQVIEKLICERKTLPRAIACANDLAAIGAIRALARHGIAVPRDVAVTGFDDLPVARRLRPPLTTVRTPIWELGTIAFELLHSAIRNRHPQQRNVVLPDRLICRESCGCPPEPDKTDTVPISA